MSENVDSTRRDPPIVNFVKSSDGASIGFNKTGNGPALILVHGAGQSSANFQKLASDLSASFTVFVPDRRGRGKSGPYGDFHGLRTEIEDLRALREASGAHYVFGLSAGAVIAIETARAEPEITKLAIYEPPLSFNGVHHGEWAPRYERELRSRKWGSALVTVLKGTADRTVIRYVPRVLLSVPLNFIIKRTANRPTPDGTTPLRDLIPTIHYDAQTVADAAGPLERFADLKCDILLLGGSKSARNLTESLDGLSKILPRAKRVTLQGVGHTAADNGGHPVLVAEQLRAFLV